MRAVVLHRGTNGGLGIGFAKAFEDVGQDAESQVVNATEAMPFCREASQNDLIRCSQVKRHACYKITKLVSNGVAAASGKVT